MLRKLDGCFAVSGGECSDIESIMGGDWFGHKEILAEATLGFSLESRSDESSSFGAGSCFLAIDANTLKRFSDKLQGN